MAKTFQDLQVWQLAIDLAQDIYLLTRSLPKTETYGLVDQLKRAVVSISANIAEGFGRYHPKDKQKFLYNARGSLMEVQSLLILSDKLFKLDQQRLDTITQKIINLSVKLNNFIKSIGR